MFFKFYKDCKEKLQAQDSLLRQHTTEIHELNFMVLRVLIICSLIITAFMFIVSLIPGAILCNKTFRIFFFITTLIFLSAAATVHSKKKFIKNHALAFLYLKIFFNQVFFISLDAVIAYNRHQQVPYTLVGGFLLIQPLITIDKNLRISAWTMIISVLCIVLSFLTKPFIIAANDLINCTMFTLSGIAIGSLTRTYIISYLSIKIKEKDIDIQAEKAVSKAKSDFLALINHELRSPLNAVSGLNEMILRELTQKDHSPNKEEMLGYSKGIKLSCKTLTSIISDILDFSKINSGEFTLIPVEYGLDTMLNDLLNMIIPSARDKNLSFDINVSKDTPNVLIGDDLRIKQCVMNLLSNAVKYTDKGGILLSVDWMPTDYDDQIILLKFTVKDTGIGIKKEDIPRISSPFERLDELKNRNVEGTGLGLSIVEGILSKMGGVLHIKSEYGVGSEFSFTIRQPVILNVPIGSYTLKKEYGKRGEPSHYKSFIAPMAKILIVDDLQMNLDLICALLKCTQMHIDTATSGKKALELINLNHYNVVFIDHRMPVMDGIDTLQAIHIMNISSFKDTKYIALTANAAKDSKQLYLDAGFDDYLPKPVDCEELEKMLIKYLPQELVRLTDEKPAETVPDTGKEDGFLERYMRIDGIDWEAALKYCGTADVLKKNIRTYCTDLGKHVESMQNNLKDGNFKEYAITAHALKTELRVLGIQELSLQAANLEQSGDRNDAETLQKQTPDFIAKLKEWAERLEQTVGSIKSSRKPISEEEFNGALDSLKECAAARDLRTAENILKMMEEYELSATDAELINLTRQAVRNRNEELFIKLLKEGEP